jgi:hypothetical protein
MVDLPSRVPGALADRRRGADSSAASERRDADRSTVTTPAFACQGRAVRGRCYPHANPPVLASWLAPGFDRALRDVRAPPPVRGR